MKIFMGSKLVYKNAKYARTYKERLLGLMGKKEVKEPLVFLDCSSVHMWFMRISIDVIYLDKDMRVIGGGTLRPWIDFGLKKGCKHIIEIEEGGYKKEWEGKTCIFRE